MSATIICRLCLNTRKTSRSLYDEHNQPNGLFQMIYEYFHPKIVDMGKAKHLTDICMQCFGHIQKLICFQATIISAQLKLIEKEKAVSTVEVQTFPNSQDNLLTHPVTIKVEDEEEEEKAVSTVEEHTFPNSQDNLLTHPVTIKVEDEEEFVDESSAKDCMDRLQEEEQSKCRAYLETLRTAKEFVTVPYLKMGNSPQTELIENRNISLSKLEIIDADTASADSTDEDVPLAQVRRHQTVSKTLRSDDATVSEKLYEIPNINCIKCHLSFPSWYFLRDHFKRQHPNDVLFQHGDPDILNCHLSANKYLSSQTLAMHKAAAHPEHNNFLCKTCGRGYPTKNSLAVHYREMHNTDRKSRPKIHVLADGRTAYTCQLCGVTKYTRCGFSVHRSLKHLNISRFECTVCGRSCMTARRLREHEASHQNKRLYKCAFCPKTFRIVESVIFHRNKEHPLECKNKNFYININEPPKEQNLNLVSNEKYDNIPSTSKGAAAADQHVNEDKGQKDHTISEEDVKPDTETVQTYFIYEYGVKQEDDENVSSKFPETTEPISLPETTEPISLPEQTEPISLPETTEPISLPETTEPILLPELEKIDIELDWEDEIPVTKYPTGNRKSNEKLDSSEPANADDQNYANVFRCVYCGKYYPSQHSLSIHLSRIHPAKQPRLGCQLCGKRFHSKWLLGAHKTLCQRTYKMN